MIDQWTEELKCQRCGRAGIADLSQADDEETPTVHSVPEGFKVIESEYGVDFDCTTCDLPVEP